MRESCLQLAVLENSAPATLACISGTHCPLATWALRWLSVGAAHLETTQGSHHSPPCRRSADILLACLAVILQLSQNLTSAAIAYIITCHAALRMTPPSQMQAVSIQCSGRQSRRALGLRRRNKSPDSAHLLAAPIRLSVKENDVAGQVAKPCQRQESSLQVNMRNNTCTGPAQACRRR
jgi:hypothetical protein